MGTTTPNDRVLARASPPASGLALVILFGCTGAEPPPPASEVPEVPEVPPPATPPPTAPPATSPPVAPSSTPSPAAIARPLQLHPPTTTANLFGLTGDDAGGLFAVGAGGAILRSLDRGATWDEPVSGTSSVLRAAWRRADGVLFVAGDEGTVLRSSDRGATWRALTSGTSAGLRHLAGNAEQIFVAGEDGTIRQSRDGGLTWHAIAMPALPPAEPTPPSRRPRLLEAPLPVRVPSRDDRIRARFSASEPVAGLGSTRPGELFVLLRHLLWVTADDGATWTVLAEIRPPQQSFAHLFVDDRQFHVTGRNNQDASTSYFVVSGRSGATPFVERVVDLESRVISPPVVTVADPAGAGPSVILAGDGYAVHWSVDGGRTFGGSEQSAQMQSPYSLAKRALWAAPDGVVFAAGDHGAMMRSADAGQTWELLDGGAREPLFGGALGPDGGTIYAAVAFAVLRGRDGAWDLRSTPTALPIGAGKTAEVKRGLARCCTDVWVAADGAIVAAGEGAVWRSPDDGARWTTTHEAEPRRDCCWSLWGDADDVFGAGRDTVIRSRDGGKTWTSTSLGKLVPRGERDRMDIAGRGDHLYAVGGRGVILHSDDRGKSWTRETSGTTEFLYAAFVGENHGGELAAYAAGEAGTLLRSTSGGPWGSVVVPVTTPLSGVYGDPVRDELYVAGQEGILRSSDDGRTWSPAAPGHRNLRHVFGDGKGAVFALGDDGLVLRIPER